MSDHERFVASREALSATVARTGPTPERYQSALARYLSAVADVEEHAPPPAGGSPSSELYWNINSNLVADVMTRVVVSVDESTPFKEIVDALATARVSAVPVVDGEGKVVGVVSASDLVAKVVAGGDQRIRVGGHATRGETRRKSRAETARELMNAPALTTREHTSVVEAARTAARAHVGRLPVVDASGKLIGIVTRSDLLRVFRRSDEEIRTHLVQDVLAHQFCLDASAVEITVVEGVVTLAGQLERRTLIAPLLDAVRRTAGIVAVHDRLTHRYDDTILPLPGSSSH